MPADHTFPTDRPKLTRLLFPAGVPILWSPTLVFYDEAGRIDRGRQLAHLAFMTPHVKGYLVPGSTGDAWEMDDTEALATTPSGARVTVACMMASCSALPMPSRPSSRVCSNISSTEPRLYAGSHLPRSILKVVMESLTHHGLLPERGYLKNRR